MSKQTAASGRHRRVPATWATSKWTASLVAGLLGVMLRLLLLASLFLVSNELQVSRLKDYSNGQLTRQADQMERRIFRPPSRPLPPETIVLEGGATTFVSSLDDFLASQTSNTPPSPVHGNQEEPLGTEVPRPAKEKEERSSKLAIVFTVAPTAQFGSEAASLAASTQANQQAANSSSSSSAVVHIEPLEKRHETSEPGNKTTSAGKPIPQHWQVKSLLNVTHDYPLAYSQVICGYVWPLMAAITLFTNLMIVFVLTQKDMRTPTNVVLTAIAIADIIPIVVPVPWFVYLFAMGNEKEVLYPPVACYFYQHSTRSISEIFYFLSTWLNVLLAIQDYLAACQPKLAQKYCQIRVVIVEIVLLTCTAFLLNLPQALKVVYKPVKFYYRGKLTWGCKALQARWFKDLVGEYVALYDDIFTAIIVLFVDGGPAVLLITLTALLIRQLHQRHIQGHKLMEQARTASKRRRERHRQQEYEASARVMIFVLLAFLAVKIPFATTYTLMIIQSRFEIHFVENLLDFQKAITLTDLVFVLSYPINFTIFCCCSKKFRHKCAQLLGECNDTSKSARARLMSNISGSIISDSLATTSLGRRLSSCQQQQQQQQQQLQLFADSCGPAERKFSLAEYANNAHIPAYQQQAERTASSLARSAANSSSSSSTSAPFGSLNSEAPHRSSDNAVQMRRPCGSCEQQPGQLAKAASNAHFKRLLDEGRLCLECIVCYERIRSDSNLNSQLGLTAAASQPDGLLVGAPQQAHDSRRLSQASDSSFSWSVAPLPPPLPPSTALESLQQFVRAQVPQIVTTTCEQPNSELEDSALNFNEFHQTQWQAQADEQHDFSSGNRSLASCTDGSQLLGHNHDVNEAERRQTTGGFTSGQKLRSKSRDTNDYEPLAAGHHEQRATSTSMMARFSSSDPGVKAARSRQLEQRRLTTLVSSNQVDELRSAASINENEASANTDREQAARHSQRQPPPPPPPKDERARSSRLSEQRGQLGDRQRSLSLSNSNLTTLPNATGMLADVLVSVLFGGPQERPQPCDKNSNNNKHEQQQRPAKK